MGEEESLQGQRERQTYWLQSKKTGFARLLQQQAQHWKTRTHPAGCLNVLVPKRCLFKSNTTRDGWGDLELWRVDGPGHLLPY